MPNAQETRDLLISFKSYLSSWAMGDKYPAFKENLDQALEILNFAAF